MSFWNNVVMDWIEDKLVTLTNYIWRKRRAAKQPTGRKAAPSTPTPAPKKRRY